MSVMPQSHETAARRALAASQARRRTARTLEGREAPYALRSKGIVNFGRTLMNHPG